MNENTTRQLLSPLFVAGLAALLLNDFVLKAQFANSVTGKLSDFAGLFVFPFFLSIFAPSRKRLVYSITAVAFILWKSPISQLGIDWVNSFEFIRIGRTVDYTDLVALSVLPWSSYYFDHTGRMPSTTVRTFRRAMSVFLIVVSIFAFTATSFVKDRSVWIDGKYNVEMTKAEFEKRLAENRFVGDVVIEKTTDAWPKEKYPKVETRSNEYYLRFTLSQKYCESDEIRVFSSFDDNNTNVTIDIGSMGYWCSSEPTAITHDELKAIFERAVINPLKGIVVQSN